MGVYIKGVTRKQLMKVLICSTEFLPDDCEITEVSEPHGRLVDYKTIDVDYWEDADGYHISVEAETVIEAESE